MPSAPENNYAFDAATGQLFFGVGRSRSIVGDIDLALAWTTDEDGNACLHKHGQAAQVTERMERLREIDPSLQIAIIPWEAIKDPEAGPKILDEVNLCLSISGRISRFVERIGAIAACHEIEVFPRLESERPGL